MASFFVSHSSKDREAVDRLRDRLTARGFESFFLDYDPEQGMRAGRPWERELYSALQRADAVIFLASAASVESKWCFAELTLTRSCGKPIIPIRLDPEGTLPLLSEAQWIDLAEGETAFDRLWAAMRDEGLDPSDSFRWDPNRPPYPGLLSFEPDDAAMFFGRSDLVNQLLDRLRARLSPHAAPYLTIVGPSGSGKSSLIRAGIIPRLRKLRDQWIVLEPFTPGSAPVSALARTLALAAYGSTEQRAAIERRLRDNPEELPELVKDLRAELAPRATAVLITVDQLEELAQLAAETQKADFVRILSESPRYDPELWTVFTLRSEFLGGFSQDPDLADLIQDPLVVAPLARSRLPEVIAGPAQRAGLRFEAGLIERMVEETRGGDALPLLGYTLRQLYERRPPDGLLSIGAYDSLGGVAGALRGRADEAAGRLRAEGLEQAIVPALLRLVTVDERNTPLRRRASLAEFGEPGEPRRQVIQAFVDERLLLTSGDQSTATVEVAHETLFRAWPPLREAIERSQQDLRTEAELERLARDWVSSGREDSYLLSGERLERASSWVQTPGAERFVAEFVDSSRAREQASLRRESELLAERIVADLEQDPERAILLSLAAIEEYAPAPRALFALDASVRSSRLHVSLRGHAGAVMSAKFSPDGTHIVTASRDGTARVWDAADGREMLIIRGHDAAVYAAEFSPDAAWILTVSEDCTARLWDAVDGHQVLKLDAFDRNDEPVSGAVSPDGDLIATANNSSVRLWRSRTGEELHRVERASGGIRPGIGGNRWFTTEFSRDGRHVVVGSLVSLTELWRVTTRSKLRLERELSGHATGPVHAGTFSPDGAWVATAARDGNALVWDTRNGEHVLTIAEPWGELFAAAFSPDGSAIVVGAEDGTASAWDATNAEALFELAGHRDIVNAVAYAPDGTHIATASEDGTAGVWWAGALGPIQGLAHDEPLLSASFAPSGTRIVTASGRVARIWDVNTGDEVLTLRGHTSEVNWAAYSPDGRRIVTVSDDATGMLWDADSGEQLDLFYGHDATVQCVEFSPDGARIATGSAGEFATVMLWTGDHAHNLHSLWVDGDGAVLGVAFSSDSERVAASYGSGIARIWRCADGDLITTMSGHQAHVSSARFSPDGDRVVTASYDGTARVWDARDGRELLVVRGHAGRVASAAYSVDGSRIVTASDDGTIRCWDSERGEELARLLVGSPTLTAIYSPAGDCIVAASASGVATVWEDLPPPTLLERAKGQVFRSLTERERRSYGLPLLS